MSDEDLSRRLGPELASSLSKKGYARLTPVQEAVLDPKFEGHDLRISSQTGSGKTVAIGFTLRALAAASKPTADGVARPHALVVTPTRELAKQVETELGWLYAASKVLVASVTGGSSFREERRALGRGPSIVVGTPGRLLDHLQRQSIDLSQAGAVVLDEADRMLDLGFRDDLEAILALAPQGHRTHLVSATFPREVEALAQRIQSNPANVQGTPLGSANTDIDHIVHLVKPAERTDALVNLLLSAPGEQVLVFARTRADVARVRAELAEAGFSVASLSGEMEQDERHRALSAFKHGKLQVLVATDVAARGIDHQDVARVVQLEPPNDADTYTHRSGRTGRAGRKGKSSIMVAPAGWNRLAMLLKRARVRHRFEAIPTAQAIAAAQDERLFRELTGETPNETGAGEATRDARATALAARLLAAGQGERAIAELIVQTRRAARCEPRELTLSDQHGPGSGHRPARPARVPPPARAGGSRPPRREHAEPAHRNRDEIAESWVRFRISWGETGGADARRLVPMLCRRGKIRGADIGAIRVAPDFSLVDVAQHVAGSFESATRRPDPRDPGVTVRREFGGADRAFDRRFGARPR